MGLGGALVLSKHSRCFGKGEQEHLNRNTQTVIRPHDDEILHNSIVVT